MEENTKEKIAKKTRRTVQYASLTNVLQLRRPSMEKMGVTERSMTHSPFYTRYFGYFGSLNYTKFAFCIIACMEGQGSAGRFSSAFFSVRAVSVLFSGLQHGYSFVFLFSFSFFSENLRKLHFFSSKYVIIETQSFRLLFFAGILHITH